MSDTLFDMTPYKSEVAHSYSPDWIDATGTDPSWDKPNLAPSTEGSDGNAPAGWRSAAEFTLTLASGQTLNCKFIPGLDGELSMHQFDFTGLVSPTGFKSHFVLAVEAEEFPHPSDYAQVYAAQLVAQLEQKQHQSKRTERTRRIAEAQVLHGQRADNDDSTVDPAMTENETTDSTHTPVEVVEELSPEEEADRQRLELKVERGIEQVEKTFYEIGVALRQLRDHKLYRDTHKNFEEYCKLRFKQISDRQARYLILSSEVVDDLKNRNNCSDFPLPTKASQVRSMKDLTQDQRQEVWQTGVIESGGKVPTARTIKGIVERLKERDTTPPPINSKSGDVFLICAKSGELKKYAGCWAIASQINEYTISVQVHDGDLVVQPENLEPIDLPSECEEVRAIAQRISRLRQYELLDQSADAVLLSLGRQTYLTEVAEGLLSWLENHYGVV